ncbi:MAG: YraN family protein [Rhodospirillales bacterium]|nr:YraN family protein [Rhodospirillales bacterium]
MATKPTKTRDASPVRIRAWRFGRLAERICAVVLRCKGYRILEVRHRNPAGEIDLIARRGSIVAFIEVKARADAATAAEALNPRQRARIARAAETWLAGNTTHQGADLRFDVMLVGRRFFPRHIPDAWRPE